MGPRAGDAGFDKLCSSSDASPPTRELILCLDAFACLTGDDDDDDDDDDEVSAYAITMPSISLRFLAVLGALSSSGA
jgi:hypothetical protein